MESKLTLYNTLDRRKETFEPINPPHVGMYVCGPTVYGDPHLGHARPAVTFDLLFRYLRSLGYKVRYVRNVTDVVKYEAEGVDPNVFPQSPGTYPWNADNFGPLWIPSKGATVQLTEENLPLYRRIIEIYEGNSLEVKNGVIYINGKPASKYTFGMDYYFMMGDNRHNSADSRFWGFVPEDHIVGKASVVLFSTDKEKKFPKNIRWDRMFTWIK